MNPLMKKYKTDQEAFWAGEFGNDYINRNKSAKLLSSNISFFSTILKKTVGIHSILEFGANIGMNIKALQVLLPETDFDAIEINEKAVEELNLINNLTVHHQSILEYETNKKNDFVFSKGVLIHISPSELPNVYKAMYNSTNRYICIAEYYNPSPMEISYHGHNEKMYKRDFASEIMDQYSDLSLVDYGFIYHGDNNFCQDDITWFLMEKRIKND